MFKDLGAGFQSMLCILKGVSKGMRAADRTPYVITYIHMVQYEKLVSPS